MPPPYTEAQCIAFNIGPGTKKVGGTTDVYLGANEDTHPQYKDLPTEQRLAKFAEEDLTARINLMKKAVMTAHQIIVSAAPKTTVPARGVSNAVDVSAVLKIFMAPEFYFRGAQGGYPIEMLSTIMDEMKKMVCKKPEKPTDFDFSDWLFVFGTAIGDMSHQEAEGKVLGVGTYDPGSGIKTYIKVDGLPHGSWRNAKVEQIACEAKITDIKHWVMRCSRCKQELTAQQVDNQATEKCPKCAGSLKDNRPDRAIRNVITLDAVYALTPGQRVAFHDPPKVKTSTFTIEAVGADAKSGHTTMTIQNAGRNPCPECGCAAFKERDFGDDCDTCRHPHGAPIRPGSTVEIGREIAGAPVFHVKDLGNGEFGLFLDTTAAFTPGAKIRIGGVTEIFNVAQVLKGGHAGGDGLREAVIYKEYVSQLDFLAGAGQGLMKIHDQERVIVPTSGSIAPKGLQPNRPGTRSAPTLLTISEAAAQLKKSDSEVRQLIARKQLDAVEPGQGIETRVTAASVTALTSTPPERRISEINKSGLGGGSVFTIDDIAFGMEVCLDHRTNRLVKHYETHCPVCGFVPREDDLCPKCGAVMNKDNNGNLGCDTCAVNYVPGEPCPTPAPACSGAALVAPPAEPGDPKVQIHLIPSWGMSIALGKVCCVDDGLVFNVDGMRGDTADASVLRTYDKSGGCDRHLDETGAVGDPCLGCRIYYCANCNPSNKKSYDETEYTAHGGNCPESGCGIPLSAHDFPNRALVSTGINVPPSGAATDVDMSDLKPKWQDYFVKKGSVVIYPKKPIPPAETV